MGLARVEPDDTIANNTGKMMNRRTATATQITWIGFFANLALAALKLVAGILGRSSAMIADAAHSLSDTGTDVVVLIGFRFADKPSDSNHAYGHGKYETVAAAVIGASLLFVGGGIFWNAATTIWANLKGEPLGAPRLVALVAAIVSIGVKEVLYQVTKRVGERIHSQAVIANAWHHRSDTLSSIGTTLGIGGAILLGEPWRLLDPLAAIVVSFFIVKVALRISYQSIGELTEESLDDEVEAEIIRIAASVPGVMEPHDLRTRRIGSDIAVDLHVCVDADMRVSEAHALASQVEEGLRNRFGQSTFISIHVEPLSERDSDRPQG